MPKRIDLTGQRFGRLVVVGFSRVLKRPKSSICMWECKCDCGSTRIIRGYQLTYGGSRSCGCARTETNKAKFNQKHWTNRSHKLNSGGYLRVYWGGKLRMVHHVVWEEAHNRPLQKWEHVHHKNGIRTDNRLENLELVSVGHGAGQRPEDLLKADTPESIAACLKLGQMYLAAAGIQWEPQPSQ